MFGPWPQVAVLRHEPAQNQHKHLNAANALYNVWHANCWIKHHHMLFTRGYFLYLCQLSIFDCTLWLGPILVHTCQNLGWCDFAMPHYWRPFVNLTKLVQSSIACTYHWHVVWSWNLMQTLACAPNQTSTCDPPPEKTAHHMCFSKR